MQKLYTTLILLLFSTILLNGALTRAPEDYFGRVSIPAGAEVEVLRFKTDQIVYAGTNGYGIYVSYDAGTNWGKLTSFPEEFPCVKDILVAPNKDLYAATFGGGIFYSKDNGATWVAKNKGLKNLHVQALTMTKLGKLLCGTYGSGVYYSDDKGDNWVRTDKGLRYDNVTCLLTMSTGFIIAGTWGGGFYVSRDTCKSWIKSNTQLDNLFINDMVKDEAGHVFAATNGSGVMMTGDGISWIQYGNIFHYKDDPVMHHLIDTAISAVGANSYQLLMGTRTAGFYYFDDLWNCWQNTGDFAVGITACDVSSNGTILATRSLGDVTRSTDNGRKWTICSTKIVNLNLSEYSGLEDFLNVYPSDFDKTLISISKADSIRKVYKSVNHGNDWKYLGTFNSRSVNDVEISPEGNIFIAAKEGVFGSLDSGKTYTKLCNVTDKNKVYWEFKEIEYDSTVKVWTALFNYMLPDTNKPPKKPYLELVKRMYKSTNNGQTWTMKDYGETDIASLYVDKNSTWYMNIGANLNKSTNHGSSFTSLFKNKIGTYVYGKDGNLYCADNNKDLWVYKNFGTVAMSVPFTPQGNPAKNSYSIEKMACDINGNFYVSIKLSSMTQGIIYEVYRTGDNGKNWKTLRGCFNMDQIRNIKADNNGYTYILTNALYKVLDSLQLTPPKTTAPKNNKMGEEIHPIFAWGRVPLAEEYELQIDPTDLWYATFETNVTGDSACQAVLDLFYNTNYAWRIRSKTHSAHSKWVVGYFTVGVEPPMLISPEKGRGGVPLKADLKWHTITDATHYLIQVAEDENFDKIIFEKDNYSDTTITTTQLIGLKTYYWRVKAFTKNNTSRFSEVWNFRTVLGPPQLIYPVNNSIDRLLSEEFKWSKSIEAESYYIQIAKDESFANMFYEGNVGADTFELISNMSAETTYYWRVSSVNSVGTSVYSAPWKFTTSLKAVTLRTPENKIVNFPTSGKFTWLAHNAGSEYQIQISRDSTFKTIVDDQKVNNILEFASTKLEFYKAYYWRVRLLVSQRVGLWSEIWQFKTGIESANLLNPPDKSVDQPTALRFRWYEVVGAKFYQLQISKNEQFTDLVYSMDSLIKFEQYVEKLEPEILYYWRVRVWNDESYGTSQWSSVWTFTTGKVTLILRNPKTGTLDVNIPTLLTWFAATTAEYYNLQVANDVVFANIVFDKDSIFATKITLTETDLSVSSTYYWRVKGISKQYTTPWSETWHFKTSAVSVEDNVKLSSIKLYPNPTGSGAELSINYNETCDAKILITTAEGKLIRSDEIRLLQGDNRYAIETEHLASGSYYISIVTPSGIITRELVVVR